MALESATINEARSRWQRQHWFSSGFDELRAEVERAKICASASVNTTGYNLKRLRQLHRSHAPKRGPFSICMHRADAATVSYTEVSVTKNSASMRYASGPHRGRIFRDRDLGVTWRVDFGSWSGAAFGRMRTVQLPQSLQIIDRGRGARGCAGFGAFNFGAKLIEARREPVLPLPTMMQLISRCNVQRHSITHPTPGTIT